MVMTESRVMPPSAPLESGGVISTPFFTMNRFSPVHSATKPCVFSRIASS